MKRISLLLSTLLLCLLSATAQAGDIVKEMDRISSEVVNLKLGFGGYLLAQTLTEKQKEIARENRIQKTLRGTYKFQDGEVYIIAGQESDMVLGLYKQFPEASKDKLKEVIGDLMFEFGEPTAMAHEKLIYWAFDKNGKVDEDVFDFSRQSGGTDTLATVKFSSSEAIKPDEPSSKDGEKRERVEEKRPAIYVMITSDVLSKLFLAYTAP